LHLSGDETHYEDFRALGVKVLSEPRMQNDCPTDPFEVSDAETMMNYIRSLEAGRAA
jgi:hypothetical protein